MGVDSLRVRKNMIEIDGLTKRQIALLDVLWEMESYDEVISFKSSLPVDQQRELSVLIQLLHLEVQEIDIQSMKEYPDAVRILNEVRRKSK